MAADRTSMPSEALADKIEVRLDPQAVPGNALPALARLLRAMRDRERARQVADQAGGSPAGDQAKAVKAEC